MAQLMRVECGELAVQNLVLCALDFLVPFGSSVLTSIVIYGSSGWSSATLVCRPGARSLDTSRSARCAVSA